MVLFNTQTTDVVPNHHRQNRRRERPGSRTRRTIGRKSRLQSNTQDDLHEGILDAHDASLYLPSDHHVSPVLRQTFDQSWARWKAREAEEERQAIAAIEELKAAQAELEREQIKLFGGDVGDDELYKLGILYDDDLATREHNTVKCSVPAVDEQFTPPLYTMRPSRTRRPKHARRGNRRLQLYLSLSDLSTDINIAQWLQPNTTPAIQHRDSFISRITTTDIPQSLPPPALASGSGSLPSNAQLHFLANDDIDWTFITHTNTTTSSTATTKAKNTIQSPSSESETWILLSDDS